MVDVIDLERVNKRRRQVERASVRGDKHELFVTVAQARYVLRKVFRIIEEEARREGLDSMEHQALIQIYGRPEMQLRIKELADSLDVSPAFASSLVSSLANKKLISRRRSQTDKRETLLSITPAGAKTLERIDSNVRVHIGYFNMTLSKEQREAAVLIPMSYVRMMIAPGGLRPSEVA